MAVYEKARHSLGCADIAKVAQETVPVDGAILVHGTDGRGVNAPERVI